MARNVIFASRGYKSISKQNGIALLLIVFLLALVVTGLGVKFLSGGSPQIRNSVKSNQALVGAKAAVVGYVMSGQSATNPGTFPCSEDTAAIGFSTEGQVNPSCSNTVMNVGRFAWRTMGTGDVRDGNGDKLWYALSAGFRTTPINSDSVGTLAVDGLQNQTIAILFSPGTVLATQSRPTPTASSPPIVSAYLDGENSDGDVDFITGSSSGTFNDRLASIQSDDVFPVLEKRMLGEFENYLNAYKSVWGAFPFPATFGNPTTATYVGSIASTGGFIPISNANPTTTWNTLVTPVPVIVSPPGNVVTAPACTFRTGNTRIRCDITIIAMNALNPPTVSISGVLNNTGLKFYDGLDVTKTTDFQVTTSSGSATVTSASRAIAHSLNAAGTGTVTFTGTLANIGVVRIEYRRVPPVSNWVLAASNHYLIANNWHHLVYYKVAQPFLPGGSLTCGVSCLTVNRINVTPNTVQTGIHALLISAGRKLDATNTRPAPTYNASNPAQVRPGAMLVDYFDSADNIANGQVFDSTNHPLTTFNDQIEIVEQ